MFSETIAQKRMYFISIFSLFFLENTDILNTHLFLIDTFPDDITRTIRLDKNDYPIM